jgi:ABC-type nitrate/sulfonate/bicarbonate transport system substrate-binding protein
MFTAPTRFFGFLLILAWLTLATVAAQDKSVPARKPESVTLGLSARHVLNLPIYLAARHGIFESEGFDFKPITTKTNTAIAALVSGDLTLSRR